MHRYEQLKSAPLLSFMEFWCSFTLGFVKVFALVGWQVVADASGQPVDPIFKSRAIQKEHSRKVC